MCSSDLFCHSRAFSDEHQFLLTRERPAVTEVVAWAAGNGDRSENAEYQYGKRRLRQIDGRILNQSSFTLKSDTMLTTVTHSEDR